MTFWNQNSALSSQLEDLLSKEDVKLQEIMDEAEVLQECKSQNRKLIEYLIRVDVLKELIELTTREPAEDLDEMVRYKYPNIACELLTCDVPLISSVVANNVQLLEHVYSFLEAEPPLNPLLASYFSRLMAVLISKAGEQDWFSYQVSCLQILEFIKSKQNCISLLLRHLGTSAIMDLIFKFHTKIEEKNLKDNWLAWLDDGEFVEKVVNLLKPDTDNDVKSNACQLLCDIVVSNRERCQESGETPDSDRIVQKIESVELISKLLNVMLEKPYCERSIVGGISVLLTLLTSDKRGSNEQMLGPYEENQVCMNVMTAVVPNLHLLLDILNNPPPKPAVRTTIGILDPPLGATRIEVVRFLAVLVATANQPILAQIHQLDLLNVLLDLFFKYPWNNFLHTQVEATLTAALVTETLATHVLTDCRLLQRILEAWQENDAQEKDSKPRKGYMGHLIRICNYIVEVTSSPPISTVFVSTVAEETRSQWQGLVSGPLAKVNGDQASDFKLQEKNEEEEDSNNYYQELYRRYNQLQALAPSFTGNFRDTELGDNDGNMDLNCDLVKPDFPGSDSDEYLAVQADLFNQVCSQKLQTLDDDAEMWCSIMRHNSTDDKDARAWNDDESSDDEAGGGGGGTASEEADDWQEQGVVVPPLEQKNPWSADVLSASSPDQGWANFEASPFLANFGFDLSSTIATSAPGDTERIPFDLTPTESQSFPPDCETTEDTPGLETAQVMNTESCAEVIAFSEVMDKLQNLSVSDPSSSSQDSSPSSVIMALPTEPVIRETDETPPPSAEVVEEMSKLLAEVSASSNMVNSESNRTPSEPINVTNGPTVKDSCQDLAAGDATRASEVADNLAAGDANRASDIAQSSSTAQSEPVLTAPADEAEDVSNKDNDDLVPNVKSKTRLSDEEVDSPSATPNGPVTTI